MARNGKLNEALVAHQDPEDRLALPGGGVATAEARLPRVFLCGSFTADDWRFSLYPDLAGAGEGCQPSPRDSLAYGGPYFDTKRECWSREERGITFPSKGGVESFFRWIRTCDVVFCYVNGVESHHVPTELGVAP